eukprot:COSAG04_NODE_13157_length_618_cov_0.593449_1_plen_51_part_10
MADELNPAKRRDRIEARCEIFHGDVVLVVELFEWVAEHLIDDDPILRIPLA